MWSFTNQPFAPFGYASGTLRRFSWMSTYGQASSLVEGLEEEVDSGALTLLFTDFPSGGPSSELEGEEILQLLAPRRRQQYCLSCGRVLFIKKGGGK